jgi:hypothetical protein
MLAIHFQDVESGLNAKIDGLYWLTGANAYPSYDRPKIKSLAELIK